MSKKNLIKVAENFGALSSIQIANYIIPLITLPYIAKSIGIENLGVLALSAAISSYFLVLVDFGFSYSGTKEISQARGDREKISTCYSEILVAKSILFLASAAIFIPTLSIFETTRDNQLIILASILYVPGAALFSEFLFQGIEKMKNIAILNLFVKSTSAIIIILLVKSPEDTILIPVITALSYAACGFFAIYLSISLGFDLRVSKPIAINATKRIKENLNIFASLLMPNMYNNLSVLILAAHSPLSSVGSFDLARKISIPPEQITSMFCRAFYPLLSRDINHHKTFLVAGTVLSIALGLAILILSESIILTFFGDEFSESTELLEAMLILPFALFFSSAYGTNYLYIKNKSKALRNITTAVSLGFSAIALLTIPEYGALAVIAVITGARISIGASCAVYSHMIESNINKKGNSKH